MAKKELFLVISANASSGGFVSDILPILTARIHSTHSADPSAAHLGHKLRASAFSGQALLRTICTDLRSEMPTADSQMTMSFFTLRPVKG